MMRACLAFLLMIVAGTNATDAPCSQKVWTLNLAERHHFRSFDVTEGPRGQPKWPGRPQGVVFITPEMLAVYQVLETDQHPPLARKDPSGGGGRFFLQIVFLDARQGNELQSLRLSTSADVSAVYPTHDGKFLVRTGESLHLYSASFQELTSKKLPRSSEALNQWWDLSISPSGRRLLTQHNEYFGPKSGKSTGYLLDADTLEHLHTFDVDLLNPWPAGDSILLGIKHFNLLTLNSESKLVTVNPVDGSWRPFTFPSGPCCPNGFMRMNPPLITELNGNKVKYFSPDGDLVLTMLLPKDGQITSQRGAGNFLAFAVYHRRADPFDLGIPWKPLRIEVYDLASKSKRCSIPLTKNSSPFDVASTGAVAVIHGTSLALYQP